MSAHNSPPDHESLIAEVRKVRRAGIVRLRELRLPGLSGLVARTLPSSAPGRDAEHRVVAGIEGLLREAVHGMGGGTLQLAAEYSLGLAQGTRDWPAADRRRRAAQVYGVSVERFRKHHELMVLGQVAERLVGLAAPVSGGGDRSGSGRLVRVHRDLTLRLHGRGTASVRVHAHSVDLLRDVDVVLSPSNTHFALPPVYKSSVSAALRRAGARLDATGGVVEDRVHDELLDWATRHGLPGRAVTPGTVVPTSAGALAEHGVRRIYHVAVTQPRPGTNDYDVQAADVTRGVTRAFALIGQEAEAFSPPLRSICLPLLGAGRGGLTPLESFGAIWSAVEAELFRGHRWQLHFVVRTQDRADFVSRLLAPLTAPASDEGGAR
ncbi:hypothetical protein ACIBG6_16560 [Streptomyces sp. NPDC050842]|uniref:hypothetical protein n=1 Tax=Streptomyces sp. NPDC050842 TaxID=3365636 RepID=UPI003792E853